MRLKFFAILLAACILLVSPAALAENLLINGSFDALEEGWPAGWFEDMWLYDPGVSTLSISGEGSSGICASIENTASNDARFAQTVQVSPNTTYLLSGLVKAAGLDDAKGGAGFSVLGTYGTFPAVYDTAGEWVRLQSYIITRENQSEITVAARLGFYSNDTTGSAFFDDVSLTPVDDVPDGIIPILLQDDLSGLGQADTEDTSQAEENSPVILPLIVAALVVCFLFRKWQLWHKLPKKARKTAFIEGRSQALVGKTPPFHFTKSDWLLLLSLTALAAALAFFSLGATKAPQTVYTTTGETESITFDLGTAQDFQILYYSGINQQNHTFTVSCSEDGQAWTEPYEVSLLIGDCFQWKYIKGALSKDGGGLITPANSPLSTRARYVRLQADSAGMTLMEIAFQNENGQALQVAAVGRTGGSVDSISDYNYLADEADTLPLVPSYYNSMYFDEIYHGRTAYEHAHGMATYEWTHPPLGKVLMMLSVKAFGMTPFGWRFAGALAGVFMIPAMYFMGKLLFKKIRFAALAAFLMTFDLLHLAQTRLATIDSFSVLFILVSYLFMFRYLQMSFFRDGWRTLYPLGLSGLFMGFACATKWIGMYAGLGLAMLFFWNMVRLYLDYKAMQVLGNEKQKQVSRYKMYLSGTLAACVLFFLIVPFMIYYFSYIPQFAHEGGLTFQRFIDTQKSMFSYHAHLTATHPYQSPWFEWPLILRPMWYYSGSDVKEGMVSTIMGMGNPVIWWAGVIAFVYVFIRWLIPHLKGSKITDHRPAMLLLSAAAQFTPWVFITRATFIYHYFACLVFVMLCIVYALEQLCIHRAKSGFIVQVVYMAAVLLAFIGLYPFATGIAMSRGWADAMNWFKDLMLPWWQMGGWLRY